MCLVCLVCVVCVVCVLCVLCCVWCAYCVLCVALSVTCVVCGCMWLGVGRLELLAPDFFDENMILYGLGLVLQIVVACMRGYASK